jgi:hypothetical protein
VHGVAAAAIISEVTRLARNNQTADYPELLLEIGCFGFYGVILSESNKSQAGDLAGSILLEVAGRANLERKVKKKAGSGVPA